MGEGVVMGSYDGLVEVGRDGFSAALRRCLAVYALSCEMSFTSYVGNLNLIPYAVIYNPWP